MRKSIVGLLSLLLMAGVAFADPNAFNTPRDQKGAGADSLYGGWKATTINWTSAGVQVCSGACVLGGLYKSTGQSTAGVKIYDSPAAATGTSAGKQFFPTWRFSTNDTDTNRNLIDRPMRTSDGIHVTLGANSSQETVTILYLDTD